MKEVVKNNYQYLLMKEIVKLYHLSAPSIHKFLKFSSKVLQK